MAVAPDMMKTVPFEIINERVSPDADTAVVVAEMPVE